MNLLVATREGQGVRKNDFAWFEEGEVVMFASECDGERVDGRCGCKRAMAGTRSMKAGTTFKVVDSSMTQDELAAVVRDSLERGGWLKYGTPTSNARWVAEVTDDLVALAATFPVGSVVEKRGRRFQTRVAPQAAGNPVPEVDSPACTQGL